MWLLEEMRKKLGRKSLEEIVEKKIKNKKLKYTVRRLNNPPVRKQSNSREFKFLSIEH